jgi:hypothetical protein
MPKYSFELHAPLAARRKKHKKIPQPKILELPLTTQSKQTISGCVCPQQNQPIAQAAASFFQQMLQPVARVFSQFIQPVAPIEEKQAPAQAQPEPSFDIPPPPPLPPSFNIPSPSRPLVPPLDFSAIKLSAPKAQSERAAPGHYVPNRELLATGKRQLRPVANVEPQSARQPIPGEKLPSLADIRGVVLRKTLVAPKQQTVPPLPANSMENELFKMLAQRRQRIASDAETNASEEKEWDARTKQRVRYNVIDLPLRVRTIKRRTH